MAKRPIFLEHPGDAIVLARHFQPYSRNAYLDAPGHYAVGHGYHRGVGPDAEVTRETAESLLEENLSSAREIVLTMITVELEQWQFAALLDFALTIDARQFIASGVGQLINKGEHDQAALTMLKFPDYLGRHSPELDERRLAECELYKSGRLPTRLPR